MVSKTVQEIKSLYAMIYSMIDAVFAKGEAQNDGTLMGRAAQTQTVIQGVVIVVIGMVGVTIVSSINGSFGTPTNTGLSEAQGGLISGFGSMVSLIEPLLIVLIAVVLIAVVQRIRQ